MNKCPEAGVIRSTKTVLTNPSELAVGGCIIAAFVLGCWAGSTCSNKWTVIPLKSQAIEKGFAEWQVVDQQQGITEFVWKHKDVKQE
jgi:hypothetical protein